MWPDVDASQGKQEEYSPEYIEVFLAEHDADGRGSFTPVERLMSDRFLAGDRKECLLSQLVSFSLHLASMQSRDESS